MIPADAPVETAPAPAAPKVETLADDTAPGALLAALGDNPTHTHCPSCGTQIPRGEIACPACGRSTETGLGLADTAHAIRTRRRGIGMPAGVSASAGIFGDVLRKLTPGGIVPTITGSALLVGLLLAALLGGLLWASSATGKQEFIQSEIQQRLAKHANELTGQTVPGQLLLTVVVEDLQFANANDGSGHEAYIAKLSMVSGGQRQDIGRVEGEYHAGFMWYNIKITENLLTTRFSLNDDFFRVFGLTKPIDYDPQAQLRRKPSN